MSTEEQGLPDDFGTGRHARALLSGYAGTKPAFAVPDSLIFAKLNDIEERLMLVVPFTEATHRPADTLFDLRKDDIIIIVRYGDKETTHRVVSEPDISMSTGRIKLTLEAL